MKPTALILAASMTALAGCSTITINPEGVQKLDTQPTYTDRKHFYFWGLAGEHHVDVNEACSGDRPVQMQAQKTFSDATLSLITLGIYWPRHASVWCKSTT